MPRELSAQFDDFVRKIYRQRGQLPFDLFGRLSLQVCVLNANVRRMVARKKT